MIRLILFPLIALCLLSAADSSASTFHPVDKSPSVHIQQRAPSPKPTSSTRPMRANGLSFEVLGHGGLYSFNYDRLLGRNVALGVGFSYLSVAADATVAEINVSLMTFPVYANFYFNSSPRHRILATGGITMISAQATAGGKISDEMISIPGLPFKFAVGAKASAILPMPLAGAGYEFRSDGGILARVIAYGLYVDDFYPWVGFGFGAHF